MMEADYSVELGGNDPALEMPWSASDGSVRYLNLKLHPELILEIPEAVAYPELSVFLSRMNSVGFHLETAKCDAWFSRDLSSDEEIFGVESKFVSYVDLLFSDDRRRFDFEEHKRLAAEVVDLLQRAPEMAAAAELILRHCHWSPGGLGFCITVYVTGYGDSQDEARQRWVIALKLVQNVLVQIQG